MNILSIDTTAKTVSVCIAKQDEKDLIPLVRTTSNCGFTHSETLLPIISDCLQAAQLKIDDIGILACSAGPGSFTGVRIGISCIKGLSFALAQKKIAHRCIGVSSVEALCENAANYSGYIICPVMDARRSQFYNALFSKGAGGKIVRLCQDRLPTASEIYCELCEKYAGKKVLLVGDGANLCKKLFDTLAKDGKCTFSYRVCDYADMYQDAFSVAKVALRHRSEFQESGKNLSPVYLRASQAERERIEKENKR